MSFVQATPIAERDETSIRVAIDVSGSMKKNDPNNLRVASTRLLFNLLPNNSEIGLWMFAQESNVLIPIHRVNSQSKLNVNRQLQKIHSSGLFTNIGKAITTVTSNWESGKKNKIMILLSDGIVDISKDQGVNELARRKIIDEIIPKLQRRKVKVYTIALSDNADHKLLEKLAMATGGSYQSIGDAKQLQKSFFKIFEDTVTHDSLPLNNNKFRVDKSIKELTILVFHRDDESLIRIEDPFKNTMINNGKELGIRWHNEPGYDLITIKNPEVGQWKIHGSHDENNRVMIVSELGVNATRFPQNVFFI